MLLAARLISAAALAAAALAAPAADRVTNLPGFGAPLSAFYSGYLDAGPGQHLHYIYSAPIAADPATAPVVLWSNGGKEIGAYDADSPAPCRGRLLRSVLAPSAPALTAAPSPQRPSAICSGAHSCAFSAAS